MLESKLDLSELAEFARPGSMPTYRYAVVTVPTFMPTEEFEEVLNFMGANGWKLVHVLDLANLQRMTFIGPA